MKDRHTGMIIINFNSLIILEINVDCVNNGFHHIHEITHVLHTSLDVAFARHSSTDSDDTSLRDTGHYEQG